MITFTKPMELLLEMEIKEKSAYRAVLEGLELSVVDTLKKVNYNPADNSRASIMKYSADENLSMSQKKLESFDNDARVGINEFVSKCGDLMTDFCYETGFGHLHDINLVDRGCFDISVSCLIMSRMSDNKVSAEIDLNRRLQYLKNIGIEIEKVKGMSHNQMLDTDNNRSILTKELESRGAKSISITSTRGYIRKVDFSVFPKDIVKFAVTRKDHSFEVTTNLNPDEFVRIQKNLAEMKSSFAFAQCDPNMVNTCCFVAESCFVEICDIVGYVGPLKTEFDNRFVNDRALNSDARKINSFIGENFDPDAIAPTVLCIRESLTRLSISKMHSVIRDFKIERWGSVNARIHWVNATEELAYYIDPDFELENVASSVDEYMSSFDIYVNRPGDYSLLNSERNVNVIAELFESIDGVSIKSIAVKATHNLRCPYAITDIDISIDNIAALLKLNEL